MSGKTYIVAGFGAAGNYAAKRLKKNDPAAEVHLFEVTKDRLYMKIRLPEYVAGELAREKLFAPVAEDGIKVHTQEAVIRILPGEKTVLTEDGTAYRYDKLILATGANPRIPEIPGLVQSDKTCVLRTITDADRLVERCQPGCRALVLGGGLLGLEAARSLVLRGANVTVLEAAPRLLPNIFTETESARLMEQLKTAGLNVLTDVQNLRFENNTLVLADGTTLASDLILVSAGVIPNTALAANAGLACGRGILVNEQLETSDPDIYAAGDCAEKSPGLWMAAKDQGEAAADIICGLRVSFTPPVYTPKLKISGVDLNAVRDAANGN